jgi:cobalamin biosynthetic protein CobC
LTVIDESFCDIAPETSHVQDRAGAPGVLILKSLGKFWGLAGLRLGFVIGDPDLVASLREMLGPWPVSGPALVAGRAALEDRLWADETRARLDGDAARLDALMSGAGAAVLGGTPLFRLYDVGDAAEWQARLAQGRVWSRVFPYASGWLRLGLPPADRWDQLEAALR